MIPRSTEHNDCNVFTDRSENMIACCNIWNAFPYDMVILFKIILTFPNYLGCLAYTNIKGAFHLIFWYLSFVPSFCGAFRLLMAMNAVFSVIAGVPTLFAVLDRDSRIFPRFYFQPRVRQPLTMTLLLSISLVSFGLYDSAWCISLMIALILPIESLDISEYLLLRQTIASILLL
jgi:hypothetical protein